MPSRLNGWLRLWIAGSTAWLCVIGYLGATDYSLLLERKKFEISKPGVGAATFVFSARQSDAEIQQRISETLGPQVEKDPQLYIGKVTEAPYIAYVDENRASVLASYLRMAIFPVVTTLFLGWAFVWVRKGFQGVRDA